MSSLNPYVEDVEDEDASPHYDCLPLHNSALLEEVTMSDRCNDQCNTPSTSALASGRKRRADEADGVRQTHKLPRTDPSSSPLVRDDLQYPGQTTFRVEPNAVFSSDDALPYTLVRDQIVDEHSSFAPRGKIVRTSFLSQWYSFVGVQLEADPRTTGLVAVSSPSLELLLSTYKGWTRLNLRAIADRHGLHFSGTTTKQVILDTLTGQHTCRLGCRGLVYLFRPCNNERRVGPVRQTRAIPVRRTAANSTQHALPVAEHSFPTSRSSANSPCNHVFPQICADGDRLQIIREVQSYFRDENWIMRPCAVCGQAKYAKDIEQVSCSEVPLHILRNDSIPNRTWPKDYDFEAYGRAFLESHALEDTRQPRRMSICRTCRSSLAREEQPPDAIANFQYYGHRRLPNAVKKAFEDASIHDMQLASACRATQISFVYSAEQAAGTARQKFSRGNVAIIPQDVSDVQHVLPPTPAEGEYMICVIFVGGAKNPTPQDLMKCNPVLANKNRVDAILTFLTQNNEFYRTEGITYRRENLDAICPDKDFPEGTGVSRAVEICHMTEGEKAVEAVNSGYSARGGEVDVPDDDILMEVVGFASAAQGGISHSSMKAQAWDWCVNQCRSYCKISSGTELFPDRDHRMLTFLFPNLDPWGIGGFNHPLREGKQCISFERQLRNLLLRWDSPFEKDPNFAYIGWNIVQKLEASRMMSFRVRDNQYQSMCDELMASTEVIEAMKEKWEVNPAAQPSTSSEKKAMELLNKLRVISKELQGSNGHRLKMRNEIRALLKVHGCPSLFVTINPADIQHKMVHILAGGDPESFRELSAFQRAKQVADNPKAAALFFDNMIQSFVSLILRHGDSCPGLFGESQAYYGTVEAQGRGTLHCHMLIWLRGSLSPQNLRNKMRDDDMFKQTMFLWVESIIKCELPGMTSVLTCPLGGRLAKPDRGDRNDIRTSDAPFLPDELDEGSLARFRTNFDEFVKEMAIECNWHDHRDTCWKHLKPGQPHDDAHCRMQMDGKTRAITELDPDTFSLKLRRLHPWINNFNDLIMFLLKCNMDIKFIGSGEAAKALVYYVTDYITKASLPTHLGLAALCYAICSNASKFANDHDATETKIHRSLITKVVNAMMARQEISHQQVMSYLLGGGDRYCSHTFRSLYWGELDRFMRKQESEQRGEAAEIPTEGAADQFYEIEEAIELGSRLHRVRLMTTNLQHAVEQVNRAENDFDGTVDGGIEDSAGRPVADESGLREDNEDDLQMISVNATKGKLTVSSLLYDYRLRGSEEHFERLSVWQYVSWVEKITIAAKEKRQQACHTSCGQRAAVRVRFLNVDHPQFKTHVSRLRVTPVVPVYLGPAFPRCDIGGDEYERYSRCMLTLFKPWRALTDLKDPRETWSAAFERTTFHDEVREVIANIHVERECRDARDAEVSARHESGAGGLLGSDGDVYGQRIVISDENVEDMIPGADLNSVLLPGDQFDSDLLETSTNCAQDREDEHITELLKCLSNVGLLNEIPVAVTTENESLNPNETYNVSEAHNQQKRMAYLKKHKRPQTRVPRPPENTENSFRAEIPPSASLARLGSQENHHSSAQNQAVNANPEIVTKESILRDVLLDMNLNDNEEQKMAVQIAAEHYHTNDVSQLLMYVAGIGGTGKSHVIKALVEFFARCDAAGDILLSAPTGIAAVLIGGYTLHSLCFLPKSKHSIKSDELVDIWKEVKYLIVDEVSMVSATMLSDISSRLSEAKSWDPRTHGKPFGGVNVIFMGDFGQLKPVRATSLISHRLGINIDSNQGQRAKGQGALHGIHLWRQVKTVIELRKNWRQKEDAQYADIVTRIRVGKGTSAPSSDKQSDYDVLSGRILNVLEASDPKAVEDFRDAPVIVKEKKIRDAINLRVAQRKANEEKQTLKLYRSRDRQHRKTITGSAAKRVRAMKSNITDDALGYLPLFPGMSVMITDNADVIHGIANGAEGVVQHVTSAKDDEGNEYATCAYVRVPDSGFRIDGLQEDIVPIFPLTASFQFTSPDKTEHSISRTQLPLLPAYAYVDYKS